MSSYSGHVKYHLVHKNLASPEMVCVFRWVPFIDEIRDKAKELYTENECDGVLFYIWRENPWGECTNEYYTFYDGKKFRRNFDLKWEKWEEKVE